MEKRIKTKNIIDLRMAGPNSDSSDVADGDRKEVGDIQILGSF